MLSRLAADLKHEACLFVTTVRLFSAYNRAPMATIFSASNLGQAPKNASLHHTRPLPGSISFDNAEIASKKCKKLLQFTSNFAILGVKEESI